MMDDFIHWPRPCLHLSTTCDLILSWRIDIWMKITSYVIVNAALYIYNTPHNLQEMTNNVGLTFNVGDYTPRFTTTIEQDN